MNEWTLLNLKHLIDLICDFLGYFFLNLDVIWQVFSGFSFLYSLDEEY